MVNKKINELDVASNKSDFSSANNIEPNTNKYNLIVVGAGPGGYEAAIKAAKLGMKVAVVENNQLGGTCLNRGCIPTKALLHTAHLYHDVKNYRGLGINIDNIIYDIAKMHERKDDIVLKLRSGIEQLLKINKIDLIVGKGTITGIGEVTVNNNTQIHIINGDKILIATGAVSSRPNIEGIELDNVITSDELLTMSDKVYNRLIIIGGGVIGVEFATLYDALGCEIIIIEAMDRILPTMDREISQSLSMVFKKRGIRIHTKSKVLKIADEDGLACCFEENGQVNNISADGILIAVGRKPNTLGLFSGISVDMDHGRILVDRHFKTSVNNIYAIGDVSSSVQLAHFATAQGITVVEEMIGLKPSIDLSCVPACIYTFPEIATVGLTADEAKKNNIPVRVGKFPMTANGQTIIQMQDRSFIKVVVDAESDVILGAVIMCGRATDIISEFSTAISNKLTVKQLAKVIRAHPTYSEAIGGVLDNIR